MKNKKFITRKKTKLYCNNKVLVYDPKIDYGTGNKSNNQGNKQACQQSTKKLKGFIRTKRAYTIIQNIWSLQCTTRPFKFVTKYMYIKFSNYSFQLKLVKISPLSSKLNPKSIHGNKIQITFLAPSSM